MKHECVQVELLLGRDEDLLGGDQRARRARHLTTCADCRTQERALQSVVALMQRPHPALNVAARERALAAAFESAERAPAKKVAARSLLPLAFAVAAAAVALIAVLRFGSQGESERPLPVPIATREAKANPAPPIVREPEPPAAQPAVAASVDRDWVEVRAPETHRFAHAEVALRAGTRVRFAAEARTLELAAGEVQVEVDPRPQAPFVVVTQHLRVEVLGTVFTVAPSRVSVQRGRVRVRDAHGAIVAAQLGAGESYVHHERRSRAPARSEKPDAPPLGFLHDARAALGRGDVAAARGLLARFDAAKAPPIDRAEAGTLRAECALLERDPRAAIDAYLDVAARFASLTAGENASFAAAQLAARERDPRAPVLFQRYLDRYPQGRFAAEARAARAR